MDLIKGNLITQDMVTSISQTLTDSGDSFGAYLYNIIPVPRVTNIISKYKDTDGLLRWAANVGYKRMYVQKRKATNIGNNVHSMIESFFKTGVDPDIDYNNIEYQDTVRNIECSYNNFKLWYNNLVSKGYRIIPIATETRLVCPYYGGTVDFIAEINGAKYIIDWKTSKSIQQEYFIQTSAYMWAANNGYCKEVDHIDGIGIVRCDKNSTKIDDSFLTYNNPIHAQYIDMYIKTFEAMLYTYYNMTKLNMIDHDYSLINILEDIND